MAINFLTTQSVCNHIGWKSIKIVSFYIFLHIYAKLDSHYLYLQKLARFARKKVKWDILYDFQPLCIMISTFDGIMWKIQMMKPGKRPALELHGQDLKTIVTQFQMF